MRETTDVRVKALEKLWELHRIEHTILGEKLRDKSTDGTVASNWQGGRVNGIAEAIRILAAIEPAPKPAPADDAAAGLVERLRSLADCDARAGEPLGKCMREAADILASLSAKLAAVEREQEAAIRRINEIDDYAFDATKVITWLAGGGSELFGKKIGDRYTTDLQFCAQRISDRHQRAHESVLSENKRRRAAEARAERLERLNRQMVEALRDVRTAVINADPAVLTDTLWMPDELFKGGTVVDRIDAILTETEGKADV